jgi:hypothetical protein
MLSRVKPKAENRSEGAEVGIGGEDGQFAPPGNDANDEVDVGALDSLRTAVVEEGRGLFVISRSDGQVWQRT